MTAEDNNSLGKFHFDGIPPAPCGLHQDEAIFDISAYGVVFHEVLDGAINDLKSILQGAFVLVANDAGMFYEFVKGMHGAYERISSHVSIVPQYAVRLRQLKTVLAGRCSNGDSWFQFEVGEWCPEENLCGSILHAGHYLEYKCSGLRVGPLGYSDHTDHNPLVVQFARALCVGASGTFWAACDTFKAVAVTHTQGTFGLAVLNCVR